MFLVWLFHHPVGRCLMSLKSTIFRGAAEKSPGLWVKREGGSGLWAAGTSFALGPLALHCLGAGQGHVGEVLWAPLSPHQLGSL